MFLYLRLVVVSVQSALRASLALPPPQQSEKLVIVGAPSALRASLAPPLPRVLEQVEELQAQDKTIHNAEGGQVGVIRKLRVAKIYTVSLCNLGITIRQGAAQPAKRADQPYIVVDGTFYGLAAVMAGA
ncbi:hypothetical protein DFH09DRAFT_1085817 [Mycena vulgaris]|nr:hypothetical protein DFH09DRAFT_1085817 [Mycena vulgaris]